MKTIKLKLDDDYKISIKDLLKQDDLICAEGVLTFIEKYKLESVSKKTIIKDIEKIKENNKYYIRYKEYLSYIEDFELRVEPEFKAHKIYGFITDKIFYFTLSEEDILCIDDGINIIEINTEINKNNNEEPYYYFTPDINFYTDLANEFSIEELYEFDDCLEFYKWVVKQLTPKKNKKK